jgi:hypothetical protein
MKSVPVEAVYAADQETEVQPLSPTLRQPVVLQSSNDGMLPAFVLARAENPGLEAWVKMPGVTGLHRAEPRLVTETLAALATTITDVSDMAAQFAEIEATVRSVAGLALSSNLADVIDPVTGWVRDDKINPAIVGSAQVGEDDQGQYIQGSAGERVYFLSPGGLDAAVSGVGSVSATGGTLARRAANGTLQSAAPVLSSDVATKGSVSGLVSTSVTQAVNAAFVGVPRYADWDGSTYRYGAPESWATEVTAANMVAGRPIVFRGLVDPTTRPHGMRPGDEWGTPS